MPKMWEVQSLVAIHHSRFQPDAWNLWHAAHFGGMEKPGRHDLQIFFLELTRHAVDYSTWLGFKVIQTFPQA